MHRLVALLLLFSMAFQSVWGAAEVYCQHEKGHAAQHVGHHVHELATLDDHVQSAEQDKSEGKSARGIDHDHHCCSAWVVLPQAPSSMPGQPAFSEQVTGLQAAFRSADPDPIERPNWPASL